MKNLQFNPYQYEAGRRWGKAGRVRSKKSKPISASFRGAGQKSIPISTPPPLQGEKNLRGTKQDRAKLSSLIVGTVIAMP